MFKSLIIATCLLFSTPALAQYSQPTDQTILTKGKFVWEPELAPVGRLSIRANLATQMVYVYRDDVLIGLSNISSGMTRYETPTGVFSIGPKEVLHRSKEYDANMPFAQFFIPSRGIAFHAGSTPGRRTSHGCIHLPTAFAELLFSETQTGDTVEITNDAPEIDGIFE